MDNRFVRDGFCLQTGEFLMSSLSNAEAGLLTPEAPAELLSELLSRNSSKILDFVSGCDDDLSGTDSEVDEKDDDDPGVGVPNSW